MVILVSGDEGFDAGGMGQGDELPIFVPKVGSAGLRLIGAEEFPIGGK
jgi:hypothetical protein